MAVFGVALTSTANQEPLLLRDVRWRSSNGVPTPESLNCSTASLETFEGRENGFVRAFSVQSLTNVSHGVRTLAGSFIKDSHQRAIYDLEYREVLEPEQ